MTDILGYTNVATEGAFGIVGLFAIFIIVFIVSKNYPAEIAFMTASMITTISAIFFWLMGLVPDYVVVVMALITGVSVFATIKSR